MDNTGFYTTKLYQLHSSKRTTDPSFHQYWNVLINNRFRAPILCTETCIRPRFPSRISWSFVTTVTFVMIHFVLYIIFNCLNYERSEWYVLFLSASAFSYRRSFRHALHFSKKIISSWYIVWYVIRSSFLKRNSEIATKIVRLNRWYIRFGHGHFTSFLRARDVIRNVYYVFTTFIILKNVVIKLLASIKIIFRMECIKHCYQF